MINLTLLTERKVQHQSSKHLDVAAEAKGAGKEGKLKWALEFIDELRDLEVQKLDQAMAHFLADIQPKQIDARNEVKELWGRAGGGNRLRVGFWGSMQPSNKFR